MWRVFWVPREGPEVLARLPVLRTRSDLREREASVQIRPGDPILLAPDYRVDELMTPPASRPKASDRCPQPPTNATAFGLRWTASCPARPSTRKAR